MTRSDATAAAKVKLLKAAAKLRLTVTRAFRQEPDQPRTPFNERERYGAAVVALAQFFSEVGNRQIGNRLFELGSAITDLNSGTPHALLQPVRADNRRSDPSRLWRARSHTALALEALIRSGVGQKAAAAQVARSASVAKVAGTKPKTSGLQTAILGWRKRLVAGRVKNFEGQELWLAGCEKIRDLPQHDPRLIKFAERQLSKVAELSGALSPHS